MDFKIYYMLDDRMRNEVMYDMISERDAIATFRKQHPTLRILRVEQVNYE